MLLIAMHDSREDEKELCVCVGGVCGSENWN